MELNLKTFTYDKVAKTLTAFASDFGTNNWMGRVGNRPGIKIKSHTGQTRRFVLVRATRSGEGEIQAWVFTAEMADCEVKQVTIFND